MKKAWRITQDPTPGRFRRFWQNARTTVATVALAGAAATTASADGHYKGWQSIEDGFEKATRQLLRGLNDPSCYTGSGGNIKLAFVGIPQNNVHFNDTLRGKLNRIARKSINQVAYNINVLTPRAFSTIAALNPGDPVQLRKAIEQIKSAPLTFVIQAKRPAKNIAQLSFEVFARSTEGVQSCPKSDVVFVDLEHNKIIPFDDIPTRGQKRPVIVQAWAFKHAVREAAQAIREYKSVAVKIDYQMGGACSIQNSANIFESDYFEVGQEQAAALSLGANEWPVLEAVNAELPKNAAALQLQFAPDPKHRDLLQLTLKVVSGSHTRLVKYMRVLVDPDDLAGCSALSRDFLTRLVEQATSTRRQFTIRPGKSEFAAKQDKVQFDISMDANRHLYCWIIAADRSAFVMYPWAKEQAAKQWKSGAKVSFPADFDLVTPDKTTSLGDVVYPHAARELFSCFASAKPLPEALEAEWIEKHPFNKGGGGEAGSISAKGLSQLIETMRRVEGIEEHHAWINVVEK